MNYLLYSPDDHNTGKEFPLLIFLHGAGESGTNIEIVKRNGPPKLVAQGQHFPFFILSPQSPQIFGPWNVEQVKILIDDITTQYPIDRKRIYLTGISRGGYGSWKMATLYPKLFAAIIPICGGGDPRLAERIKHIPTWVFHGAKDDIIPLSESEDMVKAIKDAGGKVKFTVYPDADHDSWTRTFNNPEVFKWLLDQKKY